ncbi:four-helix bundle copper-binding protein [Niabella ginsengisoli]|uniref:Four-helix bundle copper-binding protein n=1 Tax=Niabella ginsengisoli TaxID=522298 RepID=A0ABS9SKK2_9BACT|nr:four-helix bundle copper-binding protein [Niabella ginsengisoli]MCH5598914.1 four-helix bundle copper-binding protein [Niabella ginsengisoli]
MNHSRMIEACLACFAACEITAAESIKISNADYLRCIALCRDCIELCQLCIKLDLRDSDYRHQIMKVCIENCLDCAKECERFPNSEYHVQSAKACRVCAEEMQKMLN